MPVYRNHILFLTLALIMLINCNGTKMMTKTDKTVMSKPMGLSADETNVHFRVFSKHATSIEIAFFLDDLETPAQTFPMSRSDDSIWTFSSEKNGFNWKYYAYRVSGPTGNEHEFDDTKFIADPYSRSVVRKNNYLHPSRTIIDFESSFNWETDDFTRLKIEDAVIVEAHLKDLTYHPSAKNSKPGTYLGLVESDQNGGIHHLKELGVNTIEFLPLQDFGNIEIDYKNPELSVFNTWNAYEKNHWGYMTTFFFAPEISFASDGNETPQEWVGRDGKAINEMKQMVKSLHENGISVIMDVVYNHVSQYDENPYKFIDKSSYFNLNPDGSYCGTSGCGNDFNTAAPMSRRMIVESIKYWMEEYHIDGFRFDLAAMIDSVTIDEISKTAKNINPDVMLIGEPWGGGKYNPKQLANQNWASWNDQFRNSIKGRWPENKDYGFIFGQYWDNKNTKWYQSLFQGFTQKDNGLYKDATQSINYLESHDDHTLGDFVRIATGKIGLHDVVKTSDFIHLSDEEMTIHRLAALALFTAQGPVMFGEGQSWARSKIIAQTDVDEPNMGQLDHNSYNKDNETNWLNWDDKETNIELFKTYQTLINIRNNSKALRNPSYDARIFIESKNNLALGFIATKEDEKILVLMNPSQKDKAEFAIEKGDWLLLYSTNEIDAWHKETITLPPQSGAIWIRVDATSKDSILLK